MKERREGGRELKLGGEYMWRGKKGEEIFFLSFPVCNFFKFPSVNEMTPTPPLCARRPSRWVQILLFLCSVHAIVQPSAKTSCVFKPVHLNSGTAFLFSVYFPSAGPPAHRKETRLAGETEQDRGAKRGRKRNAVGGGGIVCKLCFKDLEDPLEKYMRCTTDKQFTRDSNRPGTFQRELLMCGMNT